METNHRTAPRWIAEAFDVMMAGPGVGDPEVEKLAAALIERLPIEAMVDAIAVLPSTREACTSLVAKIVGVLTDGDPEVVELAELYQGACRALDAAGVPHAVDRTDTDEASATHGAKCSDALDLAGRIRWLAQQRPTRLDLKRVEAERDAERVLMRETREQWRAEFERLTTERDENARLLELGKVAVAEEHARAARLADERDQLQKMYENASDDLDRERSAHQEAEAAAANREIALTVDLDNARAAARAIKEREAACKGGIMLLLEGDLPAEKLRLALAELIGHDDRVRAVAATDRQILRAKVADQAAYIEQLECEIDALEDEIWEDAP